MLGQQHHSGSQQLRHVGGLFPALRKTQVQGLMLAALGTKRLRQLPHQALGFVMQNPRQPPTGGIPCSRQTGQGRECRYTTLPYLAWTSCLRRHRGRKIHRLPGIPQQLGHLFQSGGLGQAHSLLAPVKQMPAHE